MVFLCLAKNFEYLRDCMFVNTINDRLLDKMVFYIDGK